MLFLGKLSTFVQKNVVFWKMVSFVLSQTNEKKAADFRRRPPL